MTGFMVWRASELMALVYVVGMLLPRGFQRLEILLLGGNLRLCWEATCGCVGRQPAAVLGGNLRLCSLMHLAKLQGA